MSRPVTHLRVGILGVGSIGQTIAASLDAGKIPMSLVCLADVDVAKAVSFVAKLKNPVPVVPLGDLVKRSDLVVEAAGQNALPGIMEEILEHRKDLLVLSVGGLLGHDAWFRLAEQRGCRIYIPSGAIGGLDALKAAAGGRLDCVTLTSRKPVTALRGTKYVLDQKIDVDAFQEDTEIFAGSPEDACKAFPTTSNVSASLRLAVGSRTNVLVRVVAMPQGTLNIHEIEANGEFGSLRVVTQNVPSANPRTSRLAALSAVATLEGIARSLRIGT